MSLRKNNYVKHPSELLEEPKKLISRFNDFITDHLAIALGSIVGLYLAFIIPLIALPIPAFAKIVVIISSNWIQLWALFCLQRSSNKADARRQAKEDTDHEAQTHIANVVEDNQRMLRDLIARSHT